MDKKDQIILTQLLEDSRSSVRSIAKKTKIRPSTVHQRITKLKQDGVIEKFTVKLDNAKAGQGFIVFMFVKTKPSVVLSKKILSDKRIREIFGITGEYDLLIKMKFSDVVDFNDFIIKFRAEEEVETTHTMVATATIKEEL